MLESLRRWKLKRLARGLPPDPERRFDPVRALEGDLEDASRAFAREAAAHGNESGFQYHFAGAACRRLSVIAQWT
ncbi:MAG TPA: hypothetical protein VFL83_15105 [Anaeromyxobacter sp.]|nr:hypothetical protein [Anaeromyxobacter sp.]